MRSAPIWRARCASATRALELAGVGGPLMAEEGLPSQADISGLAVLGFIDGLLAYRAREARRGRDAWLRFWPPSPTLSC